VRIIKKCIYVKRDVRNVGYKSLLVSGLTIQEAQNRLAAMEFNYYPELIANFIESINRKVNND
jgi:hypothetical protein